MTRHLFLRATLAVLLSLGAGSLSLAPACGNELEPSDATIALGDVKGGRFLFKTAQPGRYRPAPTLKTDVRIAVTGLIARATVTQEFTNPSLDKDAWAEGIYVFPLPETAAVDHLRMTVGERIIEGQIKERAEAKKIYEQAKQEGKRTSLVEQERPNIFTTSVANIAPGDRITVEIEYQETIRYDQGAFSLRVPLVVGPRYIPGTPIVFEDQPLGTGWSPDTDRVPDAARITPPVAHPSNGPINPVSLTIDLAPGFPLSAVVSPSHDILTVTEPDGRRSITLRADTAPADRDFVLSWAPAAGHAPTVSVFREQQGDDHYALLMAMPPVGENRATAVGPREVIFVIDTSGSMAGASIEQARAALLLALTRLTAKDRFNVMQFNSVTHVLFSQAQPVTAQTLRKAVHYVEQLRANGGTEILPALKMALKGSAPATHLRQVVFLTDGQVGNEDELFALIRSQLGESRLFTIGIGSAPNSHFMRKAAEFGRGTFTRIGAASDVKDRMDAMFRKLERPALTGIQLEGLADQSDMFPARIPDLYEGEPVVVAIKSRTLPSTVTIRGTAGTSEWTTVIPLATQDARAGLSVFWARQKIAALMDGQRYGQDDAATKQAVLDVALAHHLVSTYTSLVAVDVTPVRPVNEPLQTHAMKTNLPDGQDYQAIFGLPKTATSGQLQIRLGLVLLLAASLMWTVRGYRKQIA
ncbi:MAG: marine proteobacterial sortase target protein [Nitrospira sp.]